jgi:hypothetical protein
MGTVSYENTSLGRGHSSHDGGGVGAERFHARHPRPPAGEKAAFPVSLRGRRLRVFVRGQQLRTGERAFEVPLLNR